jgi:CBS domain-containing protein
LIKVRQIMTLEPSHVFLDDTVEQVAQVFDTIKSNSLFVIDREDSTLKGWVDRESIKGSQSLLQAMFEANWNDISVRESATAREALSAMVARGFRVTPVVDRRGKLTGTVSLKALEELALFDPSGGEGHSA